MSTYRVKYNQIINERVTTEVEADSKNEALEKIREGDEELLDSRFVGHVEDSFDDVRINER